MEEAKRENYHEWIVPKAEDPDAPKVIEFYESLQELLQPYMPADTEEDSDLQYSTPELVQAIEEHYAIPQGDPDASGIDKEQLVDYMKAIGYKCMNTGGLHLCWLLKKRVRPV